MGIEGIPDWEKRLARVDAFWDRQILDRPVVCVYAPKSDPRYPWPVEKTYASHRDRWMDFETIADRALADAMNREYLGDALPHTYPKLSRRMRSSAWCARWLAGARLVTPHAVPTPEHLLTRDRKRNRRGVKLVGWVLSGGVSYAVESHDE
ncbi:MAG: hypothetical protein WCS01_12125 [bacterium]